MPRRVVLPLLSLLIGLGMGAGFGLVFMWLVNNVLAGWLGPRFSRVGWGDVVCLSAAFGIAMASSARLLSSLHED